MTEPPAARTTAARFRVATDTGGTFNDFVVFDEAAGAYRIMKVPSTPEHPEQALLNGFADHERDGLPVEDVAVFTHGTTVGTNALLEQRGARVGLAVTRGFRGIYEAMEQSRPFGPAVFDLGYTKPELLAPEHRTCEIDERVAATGDVEHRIDDACIAATLTALRAASVESVAICLLFSFLNDENEQQLANALRAAEPSWTITTSSELLPQLREYFRLSTTVVNAYVSPVLGRYVARLSTELDRMGVAVGRRFTMQSNGGSVPFDRTSERGVATILSGPAGGVTAAVAIGQAAGRTDLITFDMGGTSCDVALVQDGEPTISDQSTVEGRHIAVPMLDINTVSAGGGTVASVDAHGSLTVGPRSAGAVPGPAAYGRGGQAATVTDANVVLGYLNPTHLLDGALAVDAAAARRVVRDVAERLGIDVVRAADGIVRIVDVKMGQAIRSISTERGFDLRDFTLVAFGGAGPLHACQIALDLGIPRVLVPQAPGATSALGLLMSDVKHDYVRSRLGDIAQLDVELADATFADMGTAAVKTLQQEGFGADDITLRYFLDMRYAGQGYENPVPVRGLPLGADDIAGYRQDFDAIHERCHGHAAPDQAVEIVNYRVQAIGRVPRVVMPTVAPAAGPVTDAVTGSRSAFFPDAAHADDAGFVDTPVYARALLGAGHRITGPAIVEQYDSTVVVFPAQTAAVDDHGNLVITSERSAT